MKIYTRAQFRVGQVLHLVDVDVWPQRRPIHDAIDPDLPRYETVSGKVIDFHNGDECTLNVAVIEQ